MSLHEHYPAYGGRGPSDLVVGLTLGAIATIFMILRVYVRLKVNNFGTAALICFLVAWTLTAVTQCFGVIAVLHGLGNHIIAIEEVGELRNFLFFTWMTVFFFNMAIPTGKVAVCFFLIEMIGPSNPKIRRSLMALAVFNIVVNIPQILLNWLQCSPPHALWDPLLQDQCAHWKSVHYTYFVGAVAVLSDFYLAIVPIHILIPLRIDRKLKLGLCFLMGLGVFAGVAAIIRTWAASFILTDDSSYGVGILFRWGEAEEWIVLITMSIPPVWPLFRPLTHNFINSSLSRRSQDMYKKYLSTNPTITDVNDFYSQSFPPTMVTTTINVSSASRPSLKNTTAVPSEISSRSSTPQLSQHTLIGSDTEHMDLVAMSDLEEQPRVSP
ncbi:hypothetical protein N7495_001476 [Penicillium taxi]|uniref:uncharacterized protein n=1 Tax=Penicillium taxi TaxID=168475 RepID=UPI0025457B4B|nr:uncharacterized protein N7495_001476 [Penicillium taxi]KAJ5908794.1 hypothetical protein N7495_001476 [Penicillium taxi]